MKAALKDETVTAAGLPSGFTVKAKASGSRTKAGSGKNPVGSYTICNAAGEDRTQSFTNVKTVDGTLTVTPAAITISADDVTGVGAPDAGKLTYTITGSFVEADRASLKVKLSLGEDSQAAGQTIHQILVDYAPNPNYAVTVSPGKYTTIANKGHKLSFVVNGYSGEYDGVPHGIEVEIFEGDPDIYFTDRRIENRQALQAYLKEGKPYGFSGTDAGTYTLYYVIDGEGEFISGSKDVVILPKPVTVTTGSASKAYDGKKLTSAKATIKGLETGETATVKATGKRTQVGSADNTCQITWGTAKPGNYIVIEKLGKLTVTANDAKITLTASSASKTYDGKPLTSAKVTAKGLPEGFTVKASAGGSQTKVGVGENKVRKNYVIRDAKGVDRTANFTNVKRVKGTLTVKAKPAAKPDQTLLAKWSTAGSSALKLSWSKVNGAEGYDIYFRKCDNKGKYPLYRTVKGVNTLSTTVKGLKKGLEYKAYVKAWKKVNGKKTVIGKASPTVHAVVGGYNAQQSNAAKVTVKAAKVTLKVGKTSAIKATVVPEKAGRKVVDHVAKLRYYTSNRNVATVSAKGRITAKGKGSCTVYVVANNGVRAKVKVKVK